MIVSNDLDKDSVSVFFRGIKVSLEAPFALLGLAV
jgi:hypothetical protein